MITIGRPYISNEGGETFLKASVDDTLSEKSTVLWYSVAAEYGKYLCDEVADGFLVGILPAAMRTRQDIRLEAPVSGRLLYNLYNTVMPLLCKVITDSALVMIDAVPSDLCFGAAGVGCGASLGVDSLTSLLKNQEEDTPDDFRVTHLFLTRAVHYGDRKLKEAQDAFRADADYVRKFAQSTGLPLVAMDSNIDEFYLDYEVRELQREIQITMSCVLSLQKLFGKYLFASSFSAESFKLTEQDVSYCESVLVPALGTDSTRLILTEPMMTRAAKTQYLADSPVAQKWLDVCLSTVLQNGRWDSECFGKREKLNCGKCPKCLRTLLTLEILGSLNSFADQFDLQAYHRYRNRYITYVVSCHKDAYYEEEIFNLMHERGFRIPFIVRLYSLGVRTGLYSLYKKIFKRGVLPQ